jgi:hypothetical protein
MRSGTISEKDGTDRITALEQQRGGIRGLPSATVTQNTKDQISAGLVENAKGRLIRDPINGIRNAQQLADSGNLNAKDNDSLAQSVEHAVPAAEERWRTRALSGGDTSFGDRKISPDRLVDAIYGNEGHTRGPLVSRGRYAGERALPGGVMPGNLHPWLKEAGMPDMTEEQYAADRNAQRQLMRFKLNQFQEEYGTANDAASVWFTGKPMAQAGWQANDGWHTNQWYISNFNKALARSASEGEFSTVAREAGNSLSTTITPNLGEMFAEHAQQKWITQKRMDDYAKYDLRSNVSEWIINNAGKTYEDFMADPKNVQLLEQAKQVDPGYALRIPSMINSYNNSLKDRTDEAHLRDLYAMYTDSDPKFMDHNPWDDKQLSMADKVKIARLQGEFHRNGMPDPNFARAYNDLAAMFKGEIPNKQDDPDGYKEYRGNLYIAMAAYQEANKQPIKLGTTEGNKALQEIHQLLMHKQASGYRVYEDIQVPKVVSDQMLRDHPDMTPGMIQYEYFKAQAVAQFQQLAQAKRETAERRITEFRPRGYVRGVVPPPPPPVPPVPVQPLATRLGIGATTPSAPPRAPGPPARVELTEPLRRAAEMPGTLPAEIAVTPAQEEEIAAAYRRPAPTPAANVRARRIREAHAPKTEEAENR